MNDIVLRLEMKSVAPFTGSFDDSEWEFRRRDARRRDERVSESQLGNTYMEKPRNFHRSREGRGVEGFCDC